MTAHSHISISNAFRHKFGYTLPHKYPLSRSFHTFLGLIIRKLKASLSVYILKPLWDSISSLIVFNVKVIFYLFFCKLSLNYDNDFII